MMNECTLKEAWLESKLDELQPNWRDGEDITHDTKEKIRKAANNKYAESEIFDSTCITDRMITGTTARLRTKLNITRNKKSGRPITQEGNSEVITQEGNSEVITQEGNSDKTKNDIIDLLCTIAILSEIEGLCPKCKETIKLGEFKLTKITLKNKTEVEANLDKTIEGIRGNIP